MPNYYEILRILRISRHLSQEKIAKYLNIHRSTYTYYEIGKTNPSIDTLIRISKLYNVSVDFILGIEPIHGSVEDSFYQFYSTQNEDKKLKIISILNEFL